MGKKLIFIILGRGYFTLKVCKNNYEISEFTKENSAYVCYNEKFSREVN